MSLAHAQKFYEIGFKEPALVIQLARAAKTREQFLGNAVEEGRKRGLQFTTAEAEECLKLNLEPKPTNELSDQQLEAVAGGKSSWFDQPPPCRNTPTGNPLMDMYVMMSL